MATPTHDESFLLNDTRHQDRFYYMENMVAAWWGIAISIAVLGILIHINLENLAGEIVVIIGILFGVVTLIGGMIWMFKPRQTAENFMKTRLYILYGKYALFTAMLGVLIYTLVLMFQKNNRRSTSILKLKEE